MVVIIKRSKYEYLIIVMIFDDSIYVLIMEQLVLVLPTI